MAKNPPSNAGDMGFVPSQGTKIPPAAGQLSPVERKPVHHSEDPAQPKRKRKKNEEEDTL